MTSGTLVRTYEPHGSALEVFGRREPEVLMSGPAGTGKSRACLEKIHAMCLKTPGVRALAVRKTGKSLAATGLVTFREHVAEASIKAGHVKWFGGSQQEPAAYRYANGSTMVVGGMDDPTKIMSAEYDVAYAQEATELTLNDWESITTRLRNGRISFQQLLGDCNPSHPSHWLKQRCDRGQTVMLHCHHEDNPTLWQGGVWTPRGVAYISKLDALTGARKERLRYGRWVAAEGLVYEAWDPAVHLVAPFDVPDSWTLWITVDFGYTNPTVIQFWRQDGDGRLFLTKEIYRAQTLVEDHARAVLAILKDDKGRWRGPRPRAVICDHDAEDRATLERHLGLSTVAAHKGVSDGIQAVQSRLKAAGDGRPRLFLFRDALVSRDPELDAAKRPCSTEEEVTGYVWDRGSEAQRAADKPPKEAPVKTNDHGMDAMRYMVAEVDLGGRPRIRWM
ncbi:phage terminase large subunit [Actinacidiphila rubida]|uniref:Phage terminase large subunit n=1 Tax=Actinacidiphila rubida TaxID=310780 RepID=A0A1H8SYC8_9ACTN|nr:phage terminase large subunit [Actinacidiphila rubida]SEO83344.1 phage terminase large subunit [Actinacidiphila rubida]